MSIVYFQRDVCGFKDILKSYTHLLLVSCLLTAAMTYEQVYTVNKYVKQGSIIVPHTTLHVMVIDDMKAQQILKLKHVAVLRLISQGNDVCLDLDNRLSAFT